MKLLLISTNVFALPPTGYSGLEQLVSQLACGLAAKGHSVAVVCPNGSQLGDSVEVIPTEVSEEEEKSWSRYRGRLESMEWDVILDASWQRWATMSSAGRDPELPIVNWHHTAPIYASQPPVRYSMWVGLSRAHASELALSWSVPVRHVHNGIDVSFYQSTGARRGGRYLCMSRYTPEKGFLESALLAKRLRVGLDIYGDTSIIGDPSYPQRVQREADGIFVRCFPGVSRQQTVEEYSKHRALLHLHNWNEPFSLVLLEAMACGCVPIAMRRGGPVETIIDGVTGFLVDDGEQAGSIIREDKVREISLEVMRKHVEDRFSVQGFVDRWEELLARVHTGERW